jgi:hypothetical protein
MKLRLLPGLFLLRRLTRELTGIREQLTRQTDLLARLTDRLAPQDPATDRAIVAAETGVDYVDPVDSAIVLAYAERMRTEIGRDPTDDEILSYLADEKTIDLHERLIARDQEIERLAVERRR